jgi:hypothetical protein
VLVVRKAVCIPLGPRHTTCVVPPSVWDEYVFCRRQLSWYSVSKQKGQTLVVSHQDLEKYGLEKPSAVITEAPDFSPPRLPTLEQIKQLAQSPDFLGSRPEQWDRFDPETFRKWMSVMGLSDIEPQDLLLAHSANHANFISPRFFVEQNGWKTPYSIGPTREVCSACVELFGLIAPDRPKLVTPCPGAVRFAGLNPNQYYLSSPFPADPQHR